MTYHSRLSPRGIKYKYHHACSPTVISSVCRLLHVDLFSGLLLLLPPASEGWGEVIFLVCLSVHTWEGVPHPTDGGYPLPRSGQGAPHLADGGVPPSQVWTGGYPIQLTEGTPSQVWRGGYPIQLTGGTPFPGLDREVPPGRGTPLHQTSTACTCYAAGGMPLAFTQEDFLVRRYFRFNLNVSKPYHDVTRYAKDVDVGFHCQIVGLI